MHGRVLLLVLACALPACRIGFDPSRAPDGGGDDGAPGDGDLGDGTIDVPIDADFACPASYAPLSGLQNTSRYRVIDNSSDWLAAEQDCEDDGGATHLGIPDDAAELTAYVVALPGDQIWVGITDRVTPNTWRTVTGAIPPYLPWAPGEPDGDECVYIDGAMQYVDQGCGSGRRYVCECDGSPPDPASY